MRKVRSVNDLRESLKELGISENILSYENSSPARNPFDIFRLYISHSLSEITGISNKDIYPILEHGSKLENGDLMLPVARLRLPENPVSLAKEWSEKVFQGIFD